MPQYKITYFDFPGRAEALRLALSIGGIPFEDERLHPHEFAEIRHVLPYRSLPILTIDGVAYAQSSALLRYIGKLTNLYPADLYHSLYVDEIIDTVLDFIAGIEGIDKSDGDAYERNMTTYLDSGIPRYLGGLERRIETFGDGPWAVGSDITIADLAIYIVFLNARAGAWDCFNASKLNAYPRLTQIAEHVKRHSHVAQWNQSIAEKAAAVKRKQQMAEAELNGE